MVHRSQGDEVGLATRLKSTRERRRFIIPASGPAGLVVIVARRISRRLAAKFAGLITRRIDAARRTYSRISQPGELRTFLTGIGAAAGAESQIAARYFCEHRFDLLGSGWTRVVHGMRCSGLENTSFPHAHRANPDAAGNWLTARVTAANLDESRRIWRMVDPGYTPIDWHLDFKSGYRWDETTWYRDIRFLNIRGVDVKVPWELSRLQHLPQLAIQFGRTHDDAVRAEIRNQMLDWIACNPPRFGVNWFSTMDVAIRAANMAVAYDLAVSYGAVFDADFREVVRCSIHDHALHIIENLEWSADFRGNHYLSNVAGLLFAAACLGESVSESRDWIAFAAEEVLTAVEEQFHEDGSNFEASTSYHRLSAEMVVHSLALLQRLGVVKKEALPAWLEDRVYRMGEFTQSVTTPEGTIVQVGDNDSGRFLKIATPYELLTCSHAVARYSSLDGYDDLPANAAWPDERHLDHSELGNSIAALLGKTDRRDASGERAFIGDFVRCLAGPRKAPFVPRAVDAFSLTYRSTSASLGAADATHTIALPDAGVLAARAFPDFGMWVIRSDRVHLCVRCGSVGQNGVGGHAHNDQLSFELTVPGASHFRDPGSYLYTPFPERRNAYRAASAHNGPKPAGHEPGLLGVGLFRIVDAWKGECLEFSEREFFGVMHRRSKRIYRRISIEPTRLVVEDWAKGCALEVRAFDRSALPFSPGYGIAMRVLR